MPDALVIPPGEQVTYDKETREADVVKVDTEIYTAWAEGKWIIEGERLENIMKQLARWYDVTYEWKGDRGERHTFTGRINRNDDLASVLSMLTLLGGPRFEIKGTTVYIY